MILTALLVILSSLLTFVLVKSYQKNQYWRYKGVKHLPPVIFFGNKFWNFLGWESNAELMQRLRNTFPDEPVVGFYDYLTPRLLVQDSETLQKILIKDFTHFTDHGIDINTEKNPTDEQLFVMNGTKWRAFRVKLSPIFTTGKLKEMYSIMNSVGENLLEYLRLRESTEVDARELMELFSMDVISSAVFGVDPATLKNPNSEFVRKGREFSEPSFANMVRLFLLFAFPNVMKKLGISFTAQGPSKYFQGLIRNTLKTREEQKIQRNDLIQMMMQLKSKGQLEVSGWAENEEDSYLRTDEAIPVEKVEITDDVLMAQAQGFMVAGFSGTTFAMAFAAYEMTQHLDVQDRVREEILEQVKVHGGLTYEALKHMRLLEGVVKETLRLYSPAPYLFRVCTKRYEMPNGYVVEKGDSLAVALAGIHLDPNNFPEPEKFRPDRFLDPIKPGTYIPFGEGPRICIAMRYALLVIKYGLALLYMNYKTTLSPKTSTPLKINTRLFSPIPSEKILLLLEKVPKNE